MKTFSRLCAAALFACVTATQAQEFPVKPVRIVVPYPPGGGVDRIGRLLAEKLNARWNQPVIVENRAGASGNLGAETVARAAPDGYTLLLAAQVQFITAKALYANLSFDPDALVPVSTVLSSTNVLVANPATGVDNVPRLIAQLKQQPGQFNYGSTGNGTSQHLSTELFKSMAGVGMTHVPYKGTAPALTDLLAGHIQVMFLEFSNAKPHIDAGKLRLLAVASEKRMAQLPGTPAVAETLPGFVSVFWTGMGASPGTPMPVAERISAAVADALRQPDVAQRLREQNVEAVGSTPAEAAAFWKQERERWVKVIRATGAKAD